MNKENETDNEKEKDYKNFELIYSPRTNYAKELEKEQELFNDLTLNFDPITIKIIKKHFKERLGSLKKNRIRHNIKKSSIIMASRIT